jgi:hypothetical protein
MPGCNPGCKPARGYLAKKWPRPRDITRQRSGWIYSRGLNGWASWPR